MRISDWSSDVCSSALSAAATSELFNRREQIRVAASTKLSRHWSVFGSHRRYLEANDPLRTQVGFVYEDECFTFQTTYTRDFTSDRDFEEDEKILFRVMFKNLGALAFGESIGGSSSRDDQ